MSHRRLLLLPSCLLIGAMSATPTAGAAQSPTTSQQELTRGRQLFRSHCGRCHGIQGRGGEGPTLARPTLRHASDDEALSMVIQNGIPGTGMPAFWQLSENEVRLVTAFVRSLGRTDPTVVAGDARRGQTLFETKGACTTCHIVRGRGNALGPDLTDVGLRRGPEYLIESMTNPAATLPSGLVPGYPAGYAEFLPVRVRTRNGRDLRGMRVNEDAFTIQIRDESGRIHSFEKQDLVELDKQFDHSLMPAYDHTLSVSERDDIVAYLLTLRGLP